MLVNIRLYCNLCNVPVSKVAQHLVVVTPQKFYQEKQHRIINNNNLIPEVRTNVDVCVASGDLTSRQDNHFRGKFASSEEIIHQKIVIKQHSKLT